MSEPGPGARQLAEMFHDRYEKLAPEFGWMTRMETRTFDPNSTNGRLMIAVCDEILTWFDRQDTANLNAELETERMRLAGCGVAALADTPRTVAERLTRDSPYWSASYGDVCHMVDRLMELRAALELACPEDPFDGGDLPCSFCGVDPGSVFHKSNCAWTRGRVALRGVVETTPSLNCPTCGVLYSGRGGQRGLPITLSCPNGHTWADPRGGCNS